MRAHLQCPGLQIARHHRAPDTSAVGACSRASCKLPTARRLAGAHRAVAGGGLDGTWEDLTSSNILSGTPSSSNNSSSSNSRRMSTRASVSSTELTLRQPMMGDKVTAPSLLHRPNRSNPDLDASLPLLARLRDGSDPEQGPGGALAAGLPEGSPKGGFAGWQYLVGLCALSVVICYADRSNISTAVLPMAKEFGWDKAFQGVVLSSFFFGYAVTQVLGGQLADKLGGKLVLASGVALWSFFTLVTPEAAAAGTIPLIASRVLLGIGEGVAFPSIHSLISRNVPQAWQSTAVGIVTAASYVGTALAFGISPLIITNFGWQWVFYLFAALALLWLPLWLPVKAAGGSLASKQSSDAPGQDSQEPDEQAAALKGGFTADTPSQADTVPILSRGSTEAGAAQRRHGFWPLMQRKEVWAICVAQYTQSWGMYGLLTWLPTFFEEYYHVEIADLASYTLLPYVVQGGLGLISGIFADKMIAGGWGVRQVRILLQVVGMLGPAACLMLAVSPAVGAGATLASQLITIGLGFSALTLGGVSASHLDVAPKHAGVIFGAGNTAATLAGTLSVPCTGFLLQATGSWPLVFGITAAHYVVGSVVWALWVGDKPLPEDDDPDVKLLTYARR